MQIITWLPIHVAKFNTAVECNKDQYFAVWGKITSAPQQSIQVWKSAAPINKQAIQTIVAGLNYSILQGVDPNPNNVVGAAKVRLYARGCAVCLSSARALHHRLFYPAGGPFW